MDTCRVLAPVLCLPLLAGCPDYSLHGEDPEPPLGGDTAAEPEPTMTEAPLEEWCNGVDDDGDGDVDEGFDDVDGDGDADCVDDACEPSLAPPVSEDCGPCQGEPRPVSVPPVDPWNYVIEWEWATLGTGVVRGSVISTPAIGDLDGDGLPEVVFVYFDHPSTISESLAVVDGATGATRWTQVGYKGAQAVALGDVDSDGYGDIVAYAIPDGDGGRTFLRALDRNGGELWSAEHDAFRFTGDHAAPFLTDLEGDGSVEVLVHWLILDGTTGTLIAELEDAVSDHTTTWTPVSADMDGDGVQEVLVRNGVYDHTGALLFTCGLGTDNPVFSVPTNIDADANGEVLVAETEGLTLCDDDGTVLWSQKMKAWPGPPATADFDGDGLQEFAVSLGDRLVLIDGDGTELWSTPTDAPPGLEGPTTWDIDLDGVPEVIIADEEILRVLEGTTGNPVIQITDHASTTMIETPAVADIDGDGQGEIVFGSGPCLHNPCNWVGVRALGSADGDWPWARPVYNQHAYWGGNIADDLSVPTDTTPPWLQDENLVRGQATAWETPDLPNLQAAVSDVCVASCAAEGFTQVALQVWNSGAADAESGVVLRLYGTVDDALLLLDERPTTAEIPAQGSYEWTVDTNRAALGSELFVIVDEDDAVEECIEDDNQGIMTIALCE